MTEIRLGAVALLLLTAGCDTNEPDSGVGDLAFALTAEGFLIQTEEVYRCSNTPLVFDAEMSPHRAEVVVEGVGEVAGCRTGRGPARAVVPFADGTDIRGFEVVIEKDGAVDRYVHVCGIAQCSVTPVGEPTFTRFQR